MAKARSQYRCSECHHVTAKWVGRCPDCGTWGTVDEVAVLAAVNGSPVRRAVAPTTPAVPISSIDPGATRHYHTGVSELDRVLGGGIVPGSVTLLAGDPGVGKSTLLLEVAHRWAEAGRRALYLSGEESAGQIRMRAERTGCSHDDVYLAAESDLQTALGHIEEVRPTLVVVDSVQTMSTTEADGVTGGVTQVRAVTTALTMTAKTTGVAIILVGHVTKDGAIAGPRSLEHLVDVVLHFEGDKTSTLRMVRGVKNRFGAADEVGCFMLHDNGIDCVADPSGLFLDQRPAPVSGTAVTVTLDGKRPLIGEVQALIAVPTTSTPRRAVSGIDSARAAMITAVLEKRANLRVGPCDIYLSTVGGMRLTDPSSDLAVALAIASAYADLPLPTTAIAIGEVGLAGDLRRVSGMERRLAEAARLGFTCAVVPPGVKTVPIGLRAIAADNITAAMKVLDGDRGEGRPLRGGAMAVKSSRRNVVQLARPTLRETIGRLAPGTALRDGLERILRGRTGALIVLGYDDSVEAICDGGFSLDVRYAPTRLRELSKMDGAVVLSSDGTRILRANVQLVPDPSIPTDESGTRHRSAERTAVQTGYPVVSVSHSMSIVTVYVAGERHVVPDSATILSRANQTIDTLERYKSRLDEVSRQLSTAEIEDFVTLRDVMTVVQRLEMVRRISLEIDSDVVELGTDGRQLKLQLEELVGDNDTARELIVRDYHANPDPPTAAQVTATLEELDGLSDTELLDFTTLARVFGYPSTAEAQDSAMSSRGYRAMAGIPRLQFAHVDLLVRSFGSLQGLLAASANDLQSVEGIGSMWARHIREGLSQLAESTIADRLA